MKENHKKNFIFVSQEGTTEPPLKEDSFQDIDNLQVIGFATGTDAEESFQNLIVDNTSLLKTGFDEVIAYELASDYFKNQKYFYLDSMKRRKNEAL